MRVQDDGRFVTNVPPQIGPRVVTSFGKGLDMKRVNRVSIDPSSYNNNLGDEVSFSWKAQPRSTGNRYVLIGGAAHGGNEVILASGLSSAGTNPQVYGRLGNRLDAPRNGRMDRARETDPDYEDYMVDNLVQWTVTKDFAKNNIRIYRDGTRIENNSSTRTIEPLTSLELWGSDLIVYDLKIYTRELKSNEAGNPPEVDPELRLWFDFDEAIGDNFLIDKSGSIANTPLSLKIPSGVHIFNPLFYHTLPVPVSNYPTADPSGEFTFTMDVTLAKPTNEQVVFDYYDGVRGFFIATTNTGQFRLVYCTNTPAGDYEAITVNTAGSLLKEFLTVTVKATSISIELSADGASASVTPIANFMDMAPPLGNITTGKGLTYTPANGNPAEILPDARGIMNGYMFDFGKSYELWQIAALDSSKIAQKNSRRHVEISPYGLLYREPGQWGDIYGTVFIVFSTTASNISLLRSIGDFGRGLGITNDVATLIIDGESNVVSTETYVPGDLAVIAFSSSEGDNTIGMSLNSDVLESIPTDVDMKLPIDILGHYLNDTLIDVRELAIYRGAALSAENFASIAQSIKSKWGIV